MKNINITAAVCCVIASGVIAAAVIFASLTLSESMKDVSLTLSESIKDAALITASGSSSGSSLYNNAKEYEEILTAYDACSYLHVDEAKLLELVRSGVLDGTYVYFGGSERGDNIYDYRFIRDKLLERMTELSEK